MGSPSKLQQLIIETANTCQLGSVQARKVTEVVNNIAQMSSITLERGCTKNLKDFELHNATASSSSSPIFFSFLDIAKLAIKMGQFSKVTTPAAIN